MVDWKLADKCGGVTWSVLFVEAFNYTGAATLQKYSLHMF